MAEKGSSTGSSKSSAPTTRSVSSARLRQRTGTQYAFGGYAKVAKSDGTFKMVKTNSKRS